MAAIHTYRGYLIRFYRGHGIPIPNFCRENLGSTSVDLSVGAARVMESHRSRSPRLRSGAVSASSGIRGVQPHVFDSALALELTRDWSWGHKTACQLPRDAAASHKDQLDLLAKLGIKNRDHASRSLAAMAALGSDGKFENHVKRDLVNLLGAPSFPEPHYEAVPMKVLKPKPSEDSVQMVNLPMMDVHHYFSWMYEHNRAVFNMQFLNGDSTGACLTDFWNEVIKRKDPRLEGHEWQGRPNWKSKAIPLMIHGDAVPCISVGRPSTKSFNATSVQGLLSFGSTLEQKILLYGNFPDNEIENDTHDTQFAVWQRLGWSLWFAYLGTHPTVNHKTKHLSQKVQLKPRWQAPLWLMAIF